MFLVAMAGNHIESFMILDNLQIISFLLFINVPLPVEIFDQL
jgi:hypothetical protein